MTIKLSFLGGYREQGRSCLVLNLSGDLFIFDIGIKKTFEKGYYGVPPHLDLIDVNRVKAVFISHLHEDHIALVPWLVSKGYSGPIYMTKPTLELGRKHWYKWAEQFERDGRKIYSKEDVDKTISLAKTVEKSISIGKLEIVFHPSGHAIGSAFMEIIADGHNILYLADMAKDSNVLVNPPVEEKEYNMVIVNASYGDEVLDRASLEKVLALKVSSTLKKGGVAFIPLTAVGRGQETLSILLKHKNIIGEAPIYAEKSIEEGFNTLLKYKEYLNKDFLERVGKGYFKDVEYFSPDEYGDILKNRPCVVMAPDLMLMKLSRKIFFEIKDDKNSTVFITGYQAPGTFGRALLESRKNKVFTYNGETVKYEVNVYVVPVKMHFDYAENLSLLQRIYSISEPLVVLHHGEEPKTLRLANALSRHLPPEKIVLPTVPSTFYLEGVM